MPTHKTRRTYVKRDRFGTIVEPYKTPEQVAAERVARGAALLDREIPGWADHVDLDRLDVGEGEMRGTDDSLGCILCQLDRGIARGQLLAPRAAPVLLSGSEEASDRLDDYATDHRLRERAARRDADVTEQDRADLTDDGGTGPAGDYDRLAVQLGLSYVRALDGGVVDNAKASHGFLADGETTYPALDAAWTAEIEARQTTQPTAR